MMNFKIKSRYTDKVLFECVVPDGMEYRLCTRYVLEKAIAAGANLAGAKLIGERPILQIGPIGSRCAYFTAYFTSEGVKLRAGCFFGAIDDFVEKLSKEHGDNTHSKEYRAALALILCHAELWTPKE